MAAEAVAELVEAAAAVQAAEAAVAGGGGGGGGPAASSFKIEAVPTPCSIVAFVGLVSSTRNVSFCSISVSPLTETLTLFVVWPGANVRCRSSPCSRRAA